MGVVPRLADVHCTKIRFQPGDRVIVRSHHPLTKEDAVRLRKTVERWAGDCVEVLVVDLTRFDIDLETGSG